MSAGNYVYAKDLNCASAEKWQLQYLSGNAYSIRCRSNTALGLSSDSASGGVKIDTVTVNSAWVPDVPFKFTVIPNGDGTFKLSTAESNYTKSLYQTDDLHYAGSNSYVLNTAEYDEKDPAFKWYLVATDSGAMKMKTSATYTDDGRLLKSSTDAAGNTTNYQYDSKGRITTATDPKGNVTSYTYDVMDRTTSVTSGESDVSYTRANDLLTQISVDNGSVVYGFTYDDFGRKTSVSVGNGTDSRTLASYIYVNNLVSRQSYGNGAFIDLTYDSLDRLINKTYNGDSSKYVEYLYDPNGNQYGVVDSIWGKGTYLEFDLSGRTTGVSTVDLATKITRAYESIRYNDGKNTVESVALTMFNADGSKLGTTNYSYTYGDPAKGQIPDALYNYKINDNANFAFTYDALARLQNRTLTFGDISKSESYTYKASNTAGYTTTLVESMTDLSGKTHTYTYDANGNILTDTYDGNTVSYEYDSLNRMTRFNDPVFGWTYVYVYDDRGNIVEMQEHDYTTGALTPYYNSYEYTYGDNVWADLMTAYDGVSIVYDEIGNPLNWINGEILTWQNGRQLASVNGITYGYNADGLRVSKTGANGLATEYYVVNGQYIGEVTTINGTEYVISYVYDENGTVAGINVNGTEYYFVKNIQGDVLSIIDTTGAVVANYHYDAYGSIISVTDGNGININSATHIANLNPFRYRGYMYDSESGFYYLRSRYYEPYIGRFLNADGLVSTGQGLDGNNMFAYCGNNPVMRADTSGQFWKIVVLVVAIAACVALTSCTKKTATDPIKPEDTTAGSTSSTTTGTVETKPPTPGYSDYLDALGACESSDNYSIKKGQYLGRYQMGSLALQDAGFQDSSGNWTALANSYGVYDSNDFLNSPQAQDVAVTKFNMKVCGYIKHYGLDSYIGSEYCGVTVTQSGLLAACHLVGIGAMKNALKSGAAVWDDNGTHASEYMDMFGGYDISKVW